MQKLYCQAYDMGLVDMTSSGSRIVLENSLGLAAVYPPGKPATPRRSHALLVPVFYLTTVRSQSSRPFTLVRSQFFFAGYNSSTSPNPPPKSMASQISMVAAEYQVRAIAGDEFIVIYTRGSTTV